MTATTLKIVSPTDSTVTLFDLNDSVNTFLLADPDLGVAALDTTTTEAQSVSVGQTTFTRRSLSSMRLRVRIKGSSYDDLVARVNLLGQYVAEGCTMQYVGYGSSHTRYIDVEPSPTPAIVDGRELALWKAAQLFDSPEGVELNLIRQPYLRGGALDPAANLVANPTMIRDANDDGTPNSWTAGSGTLTVDTAVDAMKCVMNSSADGFYQNVTVAAGSTYTFSLEAWVSSGNRTASVSIVSQPSGSEIAATAITATTPGTRTSVSGATTGGETSMRVKVKYTSGSTSTTVYARNAQLELASAASSFRVNAATVAMDPAGTGYARYLPVYNPGNAPAPCVLQMTSPDSSAALTDFFLNVASTGGVDGSGDLATFLNGPYYAQAESSGNGWTVTLGTDTSNPAGTDANYSGSDFARISHATAITTWARRITWTRTTKLDALRGTFEWWVRVKAADARTFWLQGRYGGGTVSASYTLDEVEFDTSEASSQQITYVKLGTVSFPTSPAISLGGVLFELWSRQDSGTAVALDVDHMELRPTDAVAHLAMPTGSTTTTLGKNLTGGTAIEVSGDYVRWDNLASTEGYVLGTIAESGIHDVTYTVRNTSNLAATVTLTIYNGSAVSQGVVTVSVGPYVVQDITARFTAAASDWYTKLVGSIFTAGDYFVVRSYAVSFVPSLGQNDQLRADPGSTPSDFNVEKLDSSGYFLARLDADSLPLWLPPGLSLIGISAEDTANAGYDDPKSVLARTLTVTPTIHPRYWT